VDTQGLLKSAVLARIARAPVFGPDRTSARERIAARLYDVKLAAPWSLHAVERARMLMSQIFGYQPQGIAQYGLMRPEAPPPWAPEKRYAVMLHAASRAAKRWPDASWIDLATRLSHAGVAAVFPGGTDAERATSARLAAAVPGAMAAPTMSIADAAALLGHADRVAGVDTGLTHLAVALDVPTVGIYCATRPEDTGLHGGANAVNVGGQGKPPSVDEVAIALGLEPRGP
jgi:heptosyltransferase-1